MTMKGAVVARACMTKTGAAVARASMMTNTGAAVARVSMMTMKGAVGARASMTKTGAAVARASMMMTGGHSHRHHAVVHCCPHRDDYHHRVLIRSIAIFVRSLPHLTSLLKIQGRVGHRHRMGPQGGSEGGLGEGAQRTSAA